MSFMCEGRSLESLLLQLTELSDVLGRSLSDADINEAQDAAHKAMLKIKDALKESKTTNLVGFFITLEMIRVSVDRYLAIRSEVAAEGHTPYMKQ